MLKLVVILASGLMLKLFLEACKAVLALDLLQSMASRHIHRRDCPTSNRMVPAVDLGVNRLYCGLPALLLIKEEQVIWRAKDIS